MDINTALEALTGLSQATRLLTFRLLVQAGPDGLSAGNIAKRLQSRQNTMSSHLKQLNQAGLINARREGRNMIYSANYDTVRGLILYLMEDCCAGNKAVCQPVAESLAKSCNQQS